MSGIVSREDFEKVQKMFKAKSNITSNNKRLEKQYYTFSGKFRCAFCGEIYTKKSSYKTRVAWDCKTVNRQARFYCKNSRLIYDDIIRDCFVDGFKCLLEEGGGKILNLLKLDFEDEENGSPVYRLNELKSLKKDAENRQSKLLDLMLNEMIDEVTFNKKNMLIQDEILKYIDEIEKFENENKENISTLNYDKILNIINKFGKNEINKTKFSGVAFNELISYGIIGGIDEKGNSDSYVIRFILKKHNNFDFFADKSN